MGIVETSYPNSSTSPFFLVPPSIVWATKQRLPNRISLCQARGVFLRRIQDKQGDRGKDMAIEILPTL